MNVYIFPYVERVQHDTGGGVVAVAHDVVEAAALITEGGDTTITEKEWQAAMIYRFTSGDGIPASVWKFPRKP
jgi:hypothetical protein